MTAYRRSRSPTSWHLSTGPDTLRHAPAVALELRSNNTVYRLVKAALELIKRYRADEHLVITKKAGSKPTGEGH